MNSPLLDESQIRDALRQVYDPEINCNIVDLGLIYDIAIEGRSVYIQMTLTTPGCPMHESISQGARNAVLQLEEVDDVDVQIVWDPPWSPAMMTDEGRVRLGMG